MTLPPIKMAVIIDDPVNTGGGYQQSINSLLFIRSLPSNLVDPVYISTLHQESGALQEILGDDLHYLHLSPLTLALQELRYSIKGRYFNKLLHAMFSESYLEKKLGDKNIDLVYFITPSRLARYLEKLNFIFTVFDLCHRDHPEFPEVRVHDEFRRREELYNSVTKKALVNILDSEMGRESLRSRYSVDSQRIIVQPFSAGRSSTSSKGKTPRIDHFKLNSGFILYPAQFWAHKNHNYILRALAILKTEYNIVIDAAFSGGDKGNKKSVEQTAKQLNIDDQIKFLGFVRDEELHLLYRHCLALVMPTYFGPTNIPPLEAFTLGTPVIYPNEPGLRDQVGNAALLIDLNDPSSLSMHLKKLMVSPELRENLIKKGKLWLKQQDTESPSKALTSKLLTFRSKLYSWKTM